MLKIIVLLSVLLSSCNVYDILSDIDGLRLFKNTPLYYDSDFDDLDSYAKIAWYIMTKVSYDFYDDTRHIKSAKETLETGKGSCGDISVLFANIAFYGMGIKMNIALVNTRAVVLGGPVSHAVVEHEGESIEAQTGMTSPYPVSYLYFFDNVFNLEE